MAKTAREILMTALKAISNYINNFKPEGEAALKAQLQLIDEIAISALEEAKAAEEAA